MAPASEDMISILDGYLEKQMWTFTKCQGQSMSWTFSKCPRLLSLRVYSGYQNTNGTNGTRLPGQAQSQTSPPILFPCLGVRVHSHISSTTWMPLNV